MLSRSFFTFAPFSLRLAFSRPARHVPSRCTPALILSLSLLSSSRLHVSSRASLTAARRYSKEFKYRPAASPIVTQKMPDGRSRVRGDDVKRIKLAQDKDRKKGGKKSA